MKSEKKQRFEKVAAKRVDKILDGLRLLGNCSNKNNYDYSKQNIDHMFEEIKSALRDTQNKFEIELKRGNQSKFKF